MEKTKNLRLQLRIFEKEHLSLPESQPIAKGITTNAEMMRYTLLVCPVSCILAAVFLFIGGKYLNKTV